MHTPLKVSHGIPIFLHQEEGWSLHLVQDYRKLNAMTMKNAYPLPLIPDILNKVSKAKARYFMKLDIHWGYNNIWIKEGDEWKATFQMNRGLLLDHLQLKRSSCKVLTD